ncbi:MAG: succinate dehydrogenase, hydrophobic membrane anchor protein [Thiobacillaceae bacterium]
MKKVVTVSHSGTGWWLAQRISAVIMLIAGGAIFLGYWFSSPFDFASWHAVFQSTLVKLTVWLLLASLCLHAWVGLREVLTDYVKPVMPRLTLNVLIIVTLVMLLVWATMILWGVNG